MSMPTSVAKLFSGVSLPIAGSVKWGQTLPKSADVHGVYAVAMTSDSYDEVNIYGNNPPIDIEILQRLIASVPTLRVDNSPPTPDTLKKRLEKFWLPDEPVLYI